MHISEIVDMGDNAGSTPLKPGDFIKVLKFSVKSTEKGDVAEIETSNTGKRYSFGKAVLGKAKSEIYSHLLKLPFCIEIHENLPKGS